MHTHLQASWGISKGTDVPASPTPGQVTSFQRRFGTADDLDAFEHTLSYDEEGAIARISALRTTLNTAGKRNPIAKNILQIDEQFLHIIFSAIISAGLSEWRPDLLGGTPDSLYNQAHELIALNTFKYVASNHAYRHLSPDLTKLRDLILLKKIYRNYVFSMMKARVLAETAKPGATVQRAQTTTDYRRRQSVRYYPYYFFSRFGSFTQSI